MAAYVPLWCKSNFSFLEGASHPEELLETCAALGVECMALTDRDGVYGIVEAHVKSRENGVRLIVGSEVTIDDGTSMVLLASSREGYAHLCGLPNGRVEYNEFMARHLTLGEENVYFLRSVRGEYFVELGRSDMLREDLDGRFTDADGHPIALEALKELCP